ncbi:MAG: DUF4190 domain-containing protein [Candidatus Dormibacteraceae bacterium]
MAQPPPPYGGDPNNPYGQQPPPPQYTPPPNPYGGGGYEQPQPQQPPYQQQPPQYTPPPDPYGGGGYPAPMQYGAAGVAAGRNNTLALVSMIVGIASIVVCCLGAPGGIAAVIMGFIARNQINQSGGAQGGGGMALTGIICGGVAILLGILIVILDLAGALTSNLSSY